MLSWGDLSPSTQAQNPGSIPGRPIDLRGQTGNDNSETRRVTSWRDRPPADETSNIVRIPTGHTFSDRALNSVTNPDARGSS